MSYIALYRKYRSQDFDQLIGQQTVTQTLRNAIATGRFPHAYLFCGPRGTGKTTTARLLAKALNCLSTDAPTPDPCGSCAMCTAIADNSAIDVIEMDAASETSIENVKEQIIQNARYAPAQARYKVYIIDEVHDLSAKAFDALLKTIEEPPPFVVFILATTESQKVPLTIRSRCQRFDFRRGSYQDISELLRRVLDRENLSYEAEAVPIIARSAEGSYRDALSLLEQVVAYSGEKITVEAAHNALGTVGDEVLDQVTHVCAQSDWAAAIKLANDLIASGRDVHGLINQLSNHWRDLLVIKSGPEVAQSLSLSPERIETLRTQSLGFSRERLLAMIDILSQADRDLRWTQQHRLLLECTLLKLLSDHRPLGKAAATGHAAPLQRQAVESAAVSAADSPKTAAPVGSVDLMGLQRMWPQVLESIRKNSGSLAGLLGDASIIGLNGSVITIGFATQFHFGRIEEKRKAFITQHLNQVLGTKDLSIQCVLDEKRESEPPADAELPLQGMVSGPAAVKGAEIGNGGPESAGEAQSDLEADVIKTFNGKKISNGGS